MAFVSELFDSSSYLAKLCKIIKLIISSTWLCSCHKAHLKILYMVLGVLFHNIGLKLTLLGQFKKSVVSFEKALEACPPHERNHYGRVLQDLGVIYNRLNDYEKAVWYHKESIQVYGKLLLFIFYFITIFTC